MTSAGGHLPSTSPNLIRSQNARASFEHPAEQQMINDGSQHHHHHVHVPRHQPDVNEYKEKDERLTSTAVFPSSPHTFDDGEHIENKNERKYSLPQTTTSSSSKYEKLAVTEEMPTSSTFSSNRMTRTSDVQSDNNNNEDVLSLNHHISSNATITATHSISSDGSSPTRRFIPSAIDQQSNAYGNDQSSPTFPPPTSSSLLMHEQPNHANDQYLETQSSLNKDISMRNNQTSTASSPQQLPDEKSKSLFVFIQL